MAKFIPNEEFLHTILLYYFHKKKSVITSFHELQRTYTDNSLTKRKCKKWFECFKRGNYTFEYDEKNFSSEEEDEKEEDTLEQIGTSEELKDCEELKIMMQFFKHILEIEKTHKLSKKKTHIFQSLNCYYNIKKNNDKAVQSEKILKSLYGNINLAVRTITNLLKQIKKNIDFENVEFPQNTKKLEFLSDLNEHVEVLPPVYFSSENKIKINRKCDCRIVKIYKVLVPSPKKYFLRKLLLHFFNMRETVSYCFASLFNVYGDQVLTEKTCKRWFKRFESGNFDLNDENRSGRGKKFEDAKLEILLNDKRLKSQREIGDYLGVTKQTISKRLKKQI